MERSQLSHGQMKVRKHFTCIIHSLNLRAMANILESFNSDVVMVVNGQRIIACLNESLRGIEAITQYVFKVCL